MIGQDSLANILGPIVKQSLADQTMVCLWRNETGVTRFAESRIHQHLHEEDLVVYLKVAQAGKIGVASTNSLTPGQLRHCLDQALSIAEHSRSNPYFDFFPSPEPIHVDQAYDPKTAQLEPKARVQMVQQIIQEAQGSHLKVAGCFFTGEEELAVMDTLGRMAYQPMSTTGLKVIMVGPEASGYANAVGRALEAIQVTQLIEQAKQKCLDGSHPRQITPGPYDVLLEPEAVAELLSWLAFIAFGAKSFHEQTSFMPASIGQQIMSKQLTIYDDGMELAGLPIPFDLEGQPKKRVAFIDRGIARGVVYDTHFAKMTGVKTTGHAMFPDDPEGPQSLNLFLTPGDKTLDEMVQMIDRGLLITRFHYVNGFLNPRKALMTGMTRDGTFFIEGGKIRYPVTNLRFTQGILEAFQQVIAIGKEQRITGDLLDSFGSATVPALALRNFTFT